MKIARRGARARQRRRLAVDIVVLRRLPGLPRVPVRRVLGGLLRRGLPRAARRLVGHRPARRPADLPQLGSPAAAADLLRDPVCVRCLRRSVRARGLYEATRRSLQAVPKELPAVWLYDERGSRLYEEITRLPEYYLPRREAEILRRAGARDRRADGGANARRARLRERAEHAVPARRAQRDARALRPVRRQRATLRSERRDDRAPRTRDLGRHRSRATSSATSARCPAQEPRLVAFLGSTIGNLYPEQRARFLCACAAELGDDDCCCSASTSSRTPAASRPPTTTRGRDGGIRPKRARRREPRARGDVRAAPASTTSRVGTPRTSGWTSAFARREAHAVSVPRLGLELEFDEGERLRVEVSSKFRREASGRAGARRFPSRRGGRTRRATSRSFSPGLDN